MTRCLEKALDFVVFQAQQQGFTFATTRTDLSGGIPLTQQQTKGKPMTYTYFVATDSDDFTDDYGTKRPL